MHNYAVIVSEILDGYILPLEGDHGLLHWARVWENGVKIAERTGADLEVVKLFAVFHDSRRINEDVDEDHGYRGAELARTLLGSLIHLEKRRFELLYEACGLHTDGYTEGDITLQSCWDADRLDLGRVGVTPQPDRLCTDAGRELIDWADARATTDYVPSQVLALWGLTDQLDIL